MNQRVAQVAKPLLVGESNPYGSAPKYALYPWPLGCAGHRLCFAVLNMAEREYLRTFDRCNLVDGLVWNAAEARRNAHRVLASGRTRLVLLGRRVANAFGLRRWPLLTGPSPIDHSSPVRVVLLPHPSGRCRSWNEPDTVERARAAVKKLLEAA